MSQPALLPDDLANRVERLFADRGAPGLDAQELAAALAEIGVGLVDTNRDRCWIDERVYSDALLRRREEEARRLAFHQPRLEAEFHEDMGYGVWFRFPIDEPPWIGSPLCDDWPGYHTHFTPLPDAHLVTALAWRGFFITFGAWIASLDQLELPLERGEAARDGAPGARRAGDRALTSAESVEGSIHPKESS